MSDQEQSSSFDSSNSFYSTDSSSQNSLSVSQSVTVADEPFFNQKYQTVVAQKINEFLAEIRNDSNFQSLVNSPEVLVDTSLLHSFCFRVTAHFPSMSAESAFALFADVQGRAQWDAMCDSIRVVKQIDPLTCIYHLKLKATWPSTARDSLAVAAFRKLTDGRFVSVAWSIVDDSLCPPDPSGNFIRMHTRISANLFTPDSDHDGFTLTQLIDGDPKGSIPSYLIKKVSSKSFPATMERIKEVIQQRNFPSNFYSSFLSENLSEANSEDSSSDDPIKAELKEISKRLQQIEGKLENSENSLIKWSPLIISSISLLFLLNINRKNK